MVEWRRTNPDDSGGGPIELIALSLTMNWPLTGKITAHGSGNKNGTMQTHNTLTTLHMGLPVLTRPSLHICIHTISTVSALAPLHFKIPTMLPLRQGKDFPQLSKPTTDIYTAHGPSERLGPLHLPFLKVPGYSSMRMCKSLLVCK
jgi:hypothetical protein